MRDIHSPFSRAQIKKDIGQHIQWKIKSGCHAGMRHAHGLPVHGQRTRTNAKTQKRLAAPRARAMGYQMWRPKAKKKGKKDKGKK